MPPAKKIDEAPVCTVPVHGAYAYAGDVSPGEAWEAISADPNAMLVDVRTPQEWKSVGLPEIKGAKGRMAKVSWKLYPNYTLNQDFAAQLEAAGAQPELQLYFLCRSGGRSTDAAIAMTASGYTHCYNIAGGFEGRADETGKRGAIDGWKAAGLPWRLA